MPDKGIFGPEYVLTYPRPDFETKLLARWDKDFKNDPNYLTKKFDLFRSCRQGVAATKWDLCAAKYDGNRCTNADFKECFHNYLKAIAKCTSLWDQVIHWLQLRAKLGHM